MVISMMVNVGFGWGYGAVGLIRGGNIEGGSQCEVTMQGGWLLEPRIQSCAFAIG
jgi:hypothetical protein